MSECKTNGQVFLKKYLWIGPRLRPEHGSIKKIWALAGPFFVNFRPFLIPIPISKLKIEKRIDGVLGIRTQGRRMIGHRSKKCLSLKIV